MSHEEDKIKGRLEQVKGKVKEEIGKKGGDVSTQVGGMVDQGRGKLREEVADIRGAVEHRNDKDHDKDPSVKP